jgi:magnesium-transporting ATPase (P-type)
MAVSFGIKSWIEGGVIFAVIILNIVVGFFQEYAAEKTMESLHSLSSPTGTVSRGGHTVSVPSHQIVPGDLVELRTGDTVPADIRLVYCYHCPFIGCRNSLTFLTLLAWLKQLILTLTKHF